MQLTEPRWVTTLRHSLLGIDRFMAGLSLLLLLALVFGQVVMRNFFDGGIPHAEVLSRYLVLYVTFFGAALAIESHRHIRIDVVACILSPERMDHIRPPLYLLSAVVCGVLTWAASRFWYDDWLYVAASERWSSVLALITPLGFALLGLHFLLGALFRQPHHHRDLP